MSLAVVGGALSVVSALVGAVGQISASQAAASAEEANADQAETEAGLATERSGREAAISLRQGKQQAEAARKGGKRLSSTQQARFGKAGVTLEGSPMLVLSETIEEAETAALRAERAGEEGATRILERGEDVAQSRKFEANQRRFGAKQTRRAGFLGAGASLLTGGLRAVDRFTPRP